MGFMDKELSTDEQAHVNEHLIRCADCRQSYDQLVETAEVLDAVSFAEPGDKVLKDMWQSPVDRAERVGAVILIIGGYVTLALYGLYEFLSKGEGPVVPKVAAVAVFIGLAMLLLSTLRERFRTQKDDPYKEVER